ncbi:DUF6339 family protein [Lederbergia wuyishanensis]|uniref:Uncharacterized protein n=1 Tax=Lederbergia wuyishanensis TaxID=1347903 RepID=A0ABU0D2E6_9BACI|nr:DUF6339 family protein [Lederbergia wuyishanensis]MCJ8007274.1 DUF6339 family protein [Lederbergia wuyishanensis]MDQ0342571.1 hypothetical protein [Lederbergia wuyishanensis]
MIGRITRKEAEELFATWQEAGKISQGKLSEYSQLQREHLLEIEERVRVQLTTQGEQKGNYYKYDLLFSLKLYKYLTIENGITEREASDDDFWRYISMKLIPDVVERRWDGLKAPRFYQESRRIWVKVLWWYIHLSWQGNVDDTYETLKYNTTDTVVQLVERPGTGGYRVSLSRALMKHFGRLAEEDPDNHTTEMFRKVMRLNTARTKVIEPALTNGGETEYVKELFEYFNETYRAIQST